MSTSNTMPNLTAPVERVVTGAPASEAAGVTPSVWAFTPFADEGDE
ncbi:hypothetical protein [Streptosporangium sp. NPDC051022]